MQGMSIGSSILRERQQKAYLESGEDAFEALLGNARREFLSLRGDNYNSEKIVDKVTEVIRDDWPDIPYSLREDIIKQIMDEVLGFGPVAELQENPNVSDIVVVNSNRIYYQEYGKTHLYEKNGRPVIFRSAGRSGRLRMLIEKLCMAGYARIDESNPGAVFSAQGMRITAMIAPIICSDNNDCTLSIRKFITVPTLDELFAQNSLSLEAAIFMEQASKGKANMGFAGPMGCGKTTQLATLARYVHPNELPILIEQVQECPMDIPNLRRLVCRPPNMEGKGEIDFEHLFRLSLTSNATRIWISEAKGGELFIILQALSSGHSGWLTFHAYSAKEAVNNRLPAMLMQNKNLNQEYNPFLLIGNSLDYICVLEQYKGHRRYKEIAEVIFNENTQKCETRPVFVRQGDELVATGHIPEEKLERMDYSLEELDYEKVDRNIFKRRG